jgi:isopenicillin N synthase-like dioxygenase
MAPSTAAQVDIPIIDISDRNKNAASELLEAASKYGFVFIENGKLGIPSKDIAHMFDISKEFFAAPTGVKQEVAISSNKAGKNHGWLTRGVEKLDPATQKRPDVKECV